MKSFFLIDYDHNKDSIYQDRMCMTAAKLALKYGKFGNRFLNCKEERIREFWDGEDDCPSFKYFQGNTKVSVVKWYIHERINVSEPIWNGSFIHGLISGGNVKWNERAFPSLFWTLNDDLLKLLKSCPFGGDLKVNNRNNRKYSWLHVPALYLKFDEDSASFIAGVLASGTLYEKDKMVYAKYNLNQEKYLKRWHIPIEDNLDSKYVLISPIWPALFTRRMPEESKETWLDIYHPFGAKIYPPILWKTYANTEFPRNGIPYLRSRRWIFNNYKSEKGTMKTLERLRVEKNLTELDHNVRQMVHEWRDNIRKVSDG